MAAPLKFNFDTGFAMPGARRDDEPEEITFSEHEMKMAKEKSYREGHAAALEEARSASENLLAAELRLITDQIEGLNSQLSGKIGQIRAEAGKLALQIAAKLSPALIARSPLAETQNLLDECLSHLSAAPHIVIRINEGLAGQLRERVDSYVAERGFDGKIMILAEPGMPPGDCKIEWADGGIERDQAALENIITNAVGRHIKAMQAPQTAGDELSGTKTGPEVEGEDE